MNTLKQLKSEHKDILKSLHEIYDMGHPTEKSYRMFKSLVPLLLEHLKDEDKNLYPKLVEGYRENQKVLSKIELFKEDISEIAKRIETFLETFNEDMCNTPEFVEEFQEIISLVFTRIDMEESDLFELYFNMIHS